jgi:hypothetical protein
MSTNGKGSKDRVKDIKTFQENWDSIDWGKKPEKPEVDKRSEKEQLLDKYFQEQ